MLEKRRYASPLNLQDGSVLIVGGLHQTKGEEDCNNQQSEDAAYTTTFELYHAHTNVLSQYDLRIENCNSGAGSWFENFDRPDQRPTLGNEYPRLHLVSVMESNQPTSRATYNGPFFPVYALNSHQKVAGCPPPQEIWEWTWKEHDFGSNQPAGTYFSRLGGSTVLLPRIDGDPVPLSASDQTLFQVARIGGAQSCTPHSGSDFARIYTYSSNPQNVALYGLSVSHEEAQPLGASRPGAKYLNAVILPTNDVFVLVGMSKADDSDCSWDIEQDVRLLADLWSAAEANGDWHDAPWNPMADMPSDDIDENYSQQEPNVGLGTPDGARMYHSTGLLLPDARVLTSGTDMDSSEGDHRAVRNLYPTIYTPPYLYKIVGEQHVRIDDDTERPKILGQTEEEADYAEAIGFQFSAPEGRTISAVRLVRPGSVTHSVDFDQRLIRCHFVVDEEEPDWLLVTMPWSPHIAQPGWYMVFMIDDTGMPSMAGWIRLKISRGDCEVEEEDPQMEFLFEGSGGEETICMESAHGLLPTAPFRMPPVAVEIRSPLGGSSLGLYRLSVDGLDWDGWVRSRLHTTLPSGLYEFYVRPQSGFLGRRFVAEMSRGPRIPVSLLSGDANGDNEANNADLQTWFDQRGRDGSPGRWLSADLNKDGRVDAADRALILDNLGRRGDR